MRICLINNLYKPYARGGAERIVEITANGLRQKGHNVFIIATKPLLKKSDTEEEQNVFYIPGFYYHLGKLPKWLRFPWHLLDIFDIGGAFKVWLILKRQKPTVVVTHNLVGLGFFIPMIIKSLRIKHLHTLHDIQLLHPSGLLMFGQEMIIDSQPAKIYQFLVKALFVGVRVVVSPSQWLMAEHSRRGFFRRSKKIILPNPIVSTGINSGQGENKKDKRFLFLYVGQIEKHKGILFLIDVFGRIAGKFPSAKLVIVGRGSCCGKAKQAAAGSAAIELVEWRFGQNVPELMRRADCLLVPSLCYENSPTVIYEAAAVGLPAIASRLGGITELVHKIGGILFNPGDANDLAKKMAWVIKNPDFLQVVGRKAGGRIKECTVERYLDILIKNV